MTLDLEDGDPARAEASPAERRRKARQSASSSAPSSSSSRPSSEQKDDNEVSGRLDRTFDRIAKSLEARGDSELADIIREDSRAMAQGLVSLTHTVKVLRAPLLIILNLAEPVLAFGRVGRVLVRRLAERRARREQERAEWEAQQVGEPQVVGA